jgi:hypothetical protein
LLKNERTRQAEMARVIEQLQGRDPSRRSCRSEVLEQ